MSRDYLKGQGIAYAVLTTDVAGAFYMKNGYSKDINITAVNHMTVYIRKL